MRTASRRLAIVAVALCAACAVIAAAGGPSSLARTGGPQPPRVKLAIHGALWHRSCAHCRRQLGSQHARSLTIPWRRHAALTINLHRGRDAIRGAAVTVTRRIHGQHHADRVAHVKTDRNGRARIRLYGPNAVWTVTYAKHSTQLRVGQHAYISFHASALRGGKRATFHGFVQGGVVPTEGLVIQLSENSGSGWQPFGRLARLHARTHRWSLSLKIPADARSYRYQLRASVLEQPDWPWLNTTSRVLKRTVG